MSDPINFITNELIKRDYFSRSEITSFINEIYTLEKNDGNMNTLNKKNNNIEIG